jgi:hypothetical protein
MKPLAKDLANWAWREIAALDQANIFSSRNKLYKAIAGRAGVSTGTVMGFYRNNENLTVDSLDRIMAGLRQLHVDLEMGL